MAVSVAVSELPEVEVTRVVGGVVGVGVEKSEVTEPEAMTVELASPLAVGV